MEAELKTDPNRTESEIRVQNSAATDMQSPLISVKEAAQRLGVSRSKAYRIDRKNGPFLFLTVGRRIFINLASFEGHLASKPGSAPEAPLQTDEGQRLCRKGGVDREAREAPAGATQPAQSSQSASPLPGCGQRDLIMPNPSLPFIVMYGVMQGMR